MYILLAQTAWQVGCHGDDAFRISHVELHDPAFCSALLETLRTNLDAVEANWNSDHAMLAIIMIIQRVISVTDDRPLVITALDLLKRIREATKLWTEQLSHLLQESSEAQQIQTMQHRLLKAALLCKSTYDVDVQNLPMVLSEAEDLTTWVTCSILVRDNCPGKNNNLPSHIRRLRTQDIILTHKLHEAILELVDADTDRGLDKAIHQTWSGYHPVPSPWTALARPSHR